MRIYKDIELRDFKAWCGAVDTMETLRQLEDVTGRNIFDTIEICLDDMGEGIDEIAVNDFLWFEDDTIADWLGFSDWEELERVANGEDEDEEEEIELEYDLGDVVELANGIVAEIIAFDEYDIELTYLVVFEDENNNSVEEWMSADEIDHKID